MAHGAAGVGRPIVRGNKDVTIHQQGIIRGTTINRGMDLGSLHPLLRNGTTPWTIALKWKFMLRLAKFWANCQRHRRSLYLFKSDLRIESRNRTTTYPVTSHA